MKRLFIICILCLLLACSGNSVSQAPAPSSYMPSHYETIPRTTPTEETVVISTPTPEPTETPTEEPTATPEPTEVPTPEPTGLCGNRFPDVFTDTPVLTENSYSDSGLSITITRYDDNFEICRHIVVYYVADVYVQDIERFETAAATDFSSYDIDYVRNIAERNDAMLAVSGDYFNFTDGKYANKGLVIRNGVLYWDRLDEDHDLCVLYRDGVMKTLEAGTFTTEEIIAQDPWQTWQFGPALFDESGEPKGKGQFNSSITGIQPRCAIGYYEPGHYCFVVVDGRNEGYSLGAEFWELAPIMKKLGCTAAYNLDGGLSAQIEFNGKTQNRNFGGRFIGDIICFRAEEGYSPYHK